MQVRAHEHLTSKRKSHAQPLKASLLYASRLGMKCHVKSTLSELVKLTACIVTVDFKDYFVGRSEL